MNNESVFFGGANGVPQQGESNRELYSPSYKNGKGGVYSAIIRFVPFFQDPNKSTISKWQSYVKNPITKVGRTLDNFSDINHPSQITNMYFRFKNTNVQTFVDYANEYLRSNQYHFSLVQIISDEQNPSLNNKIMVFRYGKTIYDKMQAELNPTIPGQYGINPFDPIHGRFFHLVVKEKSNFNNYDGSQFFDLNQEGRIIAPGIRYADAAGNWGVATDQMDENQRHILFDYVSKNSPDLSKYNYREWSQEDRDFVTSVLEISEHYANTGQLVDRNAGTLQSGYAALSAPGQPAPQPTGIPGVVAFPGATAAPQPAAAPQFGGVPAPGVPGFPGATAAPQPAAPVAAPQPAAPQFGGVPTPGVPGFPGAVAAPQPAAPVAAPGIAIPGTPAAPVAAPQPAAPGFFPGTTAPQPTAPAVAPQAAPQAATAPSVGMNVDDVLSQL